MNILQEIAIEILKDLKKNLYNAKIVTNQNMKVKIVIKIESVENVKLENILKKYMKEIFKLHK